MKVAVANEKITLNNMTERFVNMAKSERDGEIRLWCNVESPQLSQSHNQIKKDTKGVEPGCVVDWEWYIPRM